MLRGSRPAVARLWRRPMTPIYFFANLNAQRWISVQFYAKCGNIYTKYLNTECTNIRFMRELECGPMTNVMAACPAEYRWRPLFNAEKFG